MHNGLSFAHDYQPNWNHFSSHLILLIDNVHKEAVQHSQTQGQVYIAIKGCHWDFSVLIGHCLQETLHPIPVLIQEFIHEQHVLLLLSKPESTQNISFA